MARTLVAINAQGRVTLPANVRRQLHLSEGDRLEVAVDDERITLRPARVLIAEDAWAYSAENIAGIRRGLDDIREGRVFQLSYDELSKAVARGKLPLNVRRATARKRR